MKKTERKLRGLRIGIQLAKDKRATFPRGSWGDIVMKRGVQSLGSPYVRLGYEMYLKKRGERIFD